VCRTAPDKPIGGTCDRVKVRRAGQGEIKSFPGLPRRKIKLRVNRRDFNRFFGANATDEQGWKFRVHREPNRVYDEIPERPACLFFPRVLEYWRSPTTIGQPPHSGRSTAPARLSMATPIRSTKLGRGRLPALDKGAADRIFWFGRSTANTPCVMRFRCSGATSHGRIHLPRRAEGDSITARDLSRIAIHGRRQPKIASRRRARPVRSPPLTHDCIAWVMFDSSGPAMLTTAKLLRRN
jgi:hypothetical protein